MNDKDYLEKAIVIGLEGVKNRKGGPFGAVIVKDGKIVGEGCNCVTSDNDPTAHAEIVAIRSACKLLASFKLEGSKIYASTKPCPMCLAAIYWAGISEIFYSTDSSDVEKIGFDDKFIYDEIALSEDKRKIGFKQIPLSSANALLNIWAETPDKKPY